MSRDDQGRAPEPAPARGEPVSNRDWLWGAIVVVGVTIHGVAGVIWVLANLVFGCCSTRPAPGF
jgi:hypothetical protein